MIDLHCHLLPGIDDGPTAMDQSVAMARAFADAGVERAVVTPHVSWDYPHVNAAGIHAAVEELSAELARAEVPLQILPGAEVALSRAGDLPEEELDALTLADAGWLLVEPPFTPQITGIEAVLDSLLLRGKRLLLAHPERSPALAKDPERLRPYVDAGMLCQITASSLSGAFGRDVQRAGRRMISSGLAHVVSSDAHNTDRRPPGMQEGVATLQDPELADWLTRGVPAALIGGTPIPYRPEREEESRGGLLTRLRGRRR
ncbi:MAG: hypothetical protein JHC95_06030 [Solirubrobacteraceae bacterium]|nr:hypothetical protein [Solirubrobacteraceae bacterium]